MQAIEFETRIENGAIIIPPQYQQTFSEGVQVKVIVLKQASPIAEEDDIIAELLNHPLEVDHFMPQSRNEFYDS